ncbi:hypothetical protein ACS15_3718 [Ralstonia insidiosa]|uniref:Uncharacterized protein n=1 Tax=Ralstonia insidiosa TaxID=190721 RepID=A0AAC9FSI7_9RALS|nr:hypothetical protein ACS15_3718 [Ralstonia insidiosa]
MRSGKRRLRGRLEASWPIVDQGAALTRRSEAEASDLQAQAR